MTKTLNIAILGASGYTGAELIRLLREHPHARIVALTGDSQAGKPIGEIYPHLAYAGLPDVVKPEQVDYKDVDLVFCCLPHGTVQEVVKALPNHVRIIDLSADFRLADVQEYAKWYGHAHHAPELQKDAVYGLTEHARAAVKNARLVANPGCYPTSAQLPLIPLLTKGMVESDNIVIDAKSGVTGAGRAAKQANLFTELDGGMSAYGVGVHRHTPEIEQGLTQAVRAQADKAGSANLRSSSDSGSANNIQVSFTPHLIPMPRGILSTIYVRTKASAAELRAALVEAYKGEPFVHITPAGKAPSTHEVRGTNECRIGVFDGRVKGTAILVSVIDNLVKGASGQAVQNMNVMYGFEETTGLRGLAVFP